MKTTNKMDLTVKEFQTLLRNGFTPSKDEEETLLRVKLHLFCIENKLSFDDRFSVAAHNFRKVKGGFYTVYFRSQKSSKLFKEIREKGKVALNNSEMFAKMQKAGLMLFVIGGAGSFGLSTKVALLPE